MKTLAGSVNIDKYFDISVENIQSMQLVKPLYYLNQHFPYLCFSETRALLLVFNNFVVEVSLAGEFHDDTV